MSLTWVRICHDDRPVGAHTTKPIDLHAEGAAADTGTVLTVEEAKRRNGLGTAVAEALSKAVSARHDSKAMTPPDEHVPIGSPGALSAPTTNSAPRNR